MQPARQLRESLSLGALLNPDVSMNHRCEHRRCGGFTGLFATELYAVAVIYAIYFGVAFPLCRKLSGANGLPMWLLVLIPILGCFLLSSCWYIIRRCAGHSRANLSLFGAAHLLLFACSVLLPLTFWLVARFQP